MASAERGEAARIAIVPGAPKEAGRFGDAVALFEASWGKRSSYIHVTVPDHGKRSTRKAFWMGRK